MINGYFMLPQMKNWAGCLIWKLDALEDKFYIILKLNTQTSQWNQQGKLLVSKSTQKETMSCEGANSKTILSEYWDILETQYTPYALII